MTKSKINKMDDGFNPEFVETALFDGILEIPIIEKPEEIIIPKILIPFSKRNRSKDNSEFIAFYEHDGEFADILVQPDHYIDEFKNFPGIISLDNSLYLDSPLSVQILNTYRSRAIGHFMQKNGIYVIPNVRWGDERSFTTDFLPEKFAFLGLPKNSILSIGTYGACKTKEEKFYFRSGLVAMLDELTPEIVLVYGAMPDDIFYGLYERTRFIHYPDWISFVKGGDLCGNR